MINSSLNLGKNVDKEDYKVTEEQLYVYTTKPSEDDVKNNKGKAYKYGEEIPLSKDGTIWITDKKEITVLADTMEELELFKYDESKEYEFYLPGKKVSDLSSEYLSWTNGACDGVDTIPFYGIFAVDHGDGFMSK